MSPSLPSSSTQVVTRSLTALSALCLCLALGGAMPGPSASDIRQQRLDRLNRMTAEQRQVLKAQYERWKALPEAEKERWRAFDAQLDQDRSGDLRRILDSYVAWLGTLNRTERDQLRGIDNPVQRMTRVQDLKRKQSEREQFAKFPRYKRGQDEHLLSHGDFEKAVEAAWEFARNNRSAGLEIARPFGGDPNQRTPLHKAAQMLPLLGRALVRGNAPDAEKIVDAAQDAIEDKTIGKELASTRDARLRHYRMYLLLARTLVAEIGEKVPDSSTPEGKHQLEDFFTRMPSEQQEQMLSSRTDEFWSGLELRYALQQNLPWVWPSVIQSLRFQDWDRGWPLAAGNWFEFRGGNRGPQNWPNNRGNGFRGGRQGGNPMNNPPPERRDPPPPRDGPPGDRPPPDNENR